MDEENWHDGNTPSSPIIVVGYEERSHQSCCTSDAILGIGAGKVNRTIDRCLLFRYFAVGTVGVRKRFSRFLGPDYLSSEDVLRALFVYK